MQVPATPKTISCLISITSRNQTTPQTRSLRYLEIGKTTFKLVDTQKTTSRRRQEASRRNGALSQGPVTSEGKARSSRNALKHGCLATLLTFTPEDAQIFAGIHTEYVARFEPRDQVEYDLVEEIVRDKWQMRQSWIYERALQGLQAIQDAEKTDRAWKTLGEHERQALALRSSLDQSTTIPNVQRYGRSLALQAERAMKLLMELKKQPLPPELRNEPSPIPEHTSFVSVPEAVCASAPDMSSASVPDFDPLPDSPAEPLQPAARRIHAYVITPEAPRIEPEFTRAIVSLPVPLAANVAGAPA